MTGPRLPRAGFLLCGRYHPRDTDCTISQVRAPLDFLHSLDIDCPRSGERGLFFAHAAVMVSSRVAF
jgi:hypothetical protein